MRKLVLITFLAANLAILWTNLKLAAIERPRSAFSTVNSTVNYPINSSNSVATAAPARTSPTFRIGTPPAAERTISPEIVFRPVQLPIPVTVSASQIDAVPDRPRSTRLPTNPSPGLSLKEVILVCTVIAIYYHGCRKPVW